MRPLLILVVAASVLAAGCTTPKTAKNTTSDEYVDYIPTGSKIPIKVKKSEVQTSATDTATSQEMIREIQSKGAITNGH
ncbi:MAG TPA: hypothetical protein VHD32_08065 [Candidatus Didemnitutus sp.]|nr:hypothetical protein [Candidatus Didemnitutus sp.]